MGNDNCTLLCTTSPGAGGYFSTTQLPKLLPNGEPLWNCTIARNICDECLKLAAEDQLKCTHVKSGVNWRSKGKLGLLAHAIEDKATFEREILGEIVDDLARYYPAETIDSSLRAFYNSEELPSGSVSDIFICVDPSGGGASEMGVVSGYISNSGFYVVR